MRSPSSESRLYTYEVVLDEGTDYSETYVCFSHPDWCAGLVAGRLLPEWVTLETVGGALVSIRAESFNKVTVRRILAADLDFEVEEPGLRIP